MSFPKSVPMAPALLAAPLFSLAVAAQPAPDTILDEVVVTGLLRAQSLDEVPGSVTVLGAQTLQGAGQQHFQDVLALVPNLNWAAGSSRPRYFQIRGIGEREQYEGAPNPSVGFLIDDIDFSGIGMPATLFDVKQVEVLRGPQGTQYGANALAGLIVVRSNDPDPAGGYSAEASVGDHGTRSLGATATGAGGPNSAWRLSVQKYQSDGFMRNGWLGRDDTNGRDELTARLKWHAQLGEATTLDFTLLHANLDNGYDAWSIDNSRNTLSDNPGKDSQRATGSSLRLESLAGDNSLTAIASYADSKSVNSFDSDWGNESSWAPYVYDYFSRSDRRRRTAALELRLASPEARRAGEVAWLAGAYALRLRERGSDLQTGAYADPGDDVWASEDTLDNRYRATNLALFGQLNGRLPHAMHWSAGLRLEQRRARYSDAGLIDDEQRSTDLGVRDRMFGGQLSLGKDFSEALTGYVALSRGYKAGGFNLGAGVPDDIRRFDPEYLWNLETGLKARLPDGRGSAEVSVFYQPRKDQQVRSGRQLEPGNPNTYLFTTVNLPKGYSAGIEASLQYQLAPQWSVGGSLGLLRSRSASTTVDDGDGNLVPVPARENAHAPGYTAALNTTWRHPVGWFARVDWSATDAFYFDVPTDHDQRSRAYTLTHLKAGYENDRWGVHAWLRNAFDKDYTVRGFFFGNEPPEWENTLYRQKGDPRQFGVTASIRF